MASRTDLDVIPFLTKSSTSLVRKPLWRNESSIILTTKLTDQMVVQKKNGINIKKRCNDSFKESHCTQPNHKPINSILL